jgi:hypothetical protein
MSEVPAPPKDKWIAEKTPSQDATPPLPVTSCPSAIDVGTGYVCNDSALVEPPRGAAGMSSATVTLEEAEPVLRPAVD